MLYSNNEFMIYFGPNSAYRYTRTGRIYAAEEELILFLILLCFNNLSLRRPANQISVFLI